MALDVQVSLDLGGVRKLLNVPTPTAAGDAVPKSYVDSAIEGLAWKDSVRVRAGVNVTLSAPGATIDGITMSANDRVLLPLQTTTTENGLYIWNGPSTLMTRALDASTGDELEQAVVTVEEGTSAGTTWRQTAVNFVIGTGSPAFSAFGTSAAPSSETVSGILELATQAEVDAGVDDLRALTPLKLKNWSGAPRRWAQAVGDGSATSITVTHNLNSREVVVEVYRNSGNYDTVLVEVRRTSVNAVTLVFDTAPTASQFYCVVKF